MENPNIAVFACAVLAMVAALCAPLARRLALPDATLVAALGLALGVWAELYGAEGVWLGVAGAVRALDAPSDWMLGILLPIILFQGAVSLDARALAREGVAVAFLAVGAVLIAVAAVAPVATWLLPLGWAPALLLAAIVATTDPSAVLALFRESGAPARVTRWIEGESLLNDATAVAVFAAVVGLLVTETPPTPWAFAYDLAMLIGTGAAVGWVAGAALARAVFALGEGGRSTRWVWVLMAPLAVYAGASLVPGASAIVAVVAAGLAFGARSRARTAPADRLETAALLGASAHTAGLVILAVGSVMAPALAMAAPWMYAAIGAVLALVALAARAVTLWGLLPVLARLAGIETLPHAQTFAVAWGGLRGAMTLALAFAVAESSSLSEETRLAIAVPAIAFALTTLFVQGASLRPLMRALGLLERTPAERIHKRLLAAEIQALATAQSRGFAKDADLPFDEADLVVAKDPVHDKETLRAALSALATRERALMVESRAVWGLSPAAIDRMLAKLEDAAEAAMSEGRAGYRRALDPTHRPSRLARAATRAFRWGWGAPLAWFLEDEAVGLIAESSAIGRLRAEIGVWQEAIGERGAGILDDILADRARAVREARASLRARHPAFADAVERRAMAFARHAAERSALAEASARELAPPVLIEALERSLAMTGEALPRPRPDRDPTVGDRARVHPLLRDLPPRDAEALSRLARMHAFAAGERLIGPQGNPSWVWIVESGSVEAERFGKTVRLGPGRAVGHLRLLHDHIGAEVRARTAVEALAIPAPAVLAMARRHPEWAASLERTARADEETED